MGLVKESWLHPLELGVYPRQKRPPSALCCYRLMHIFTAARLVAYCECMSLTTQLSFWAARIVSGLSEPITLVLGIAAFFVQATLTGCLIRGISKRSLSLLSFFLVGVAVRISLLTLFNFVVVISFLLDLQEEFFGFFRRLAVLKFIFVFFYIVYLVGSFLIVNRAHYYIRKTQELTLIPRPSSFNASVQKRTLSKRNGDTPKLESQCCLDTLIEEKPAAPVAYPQYYAPLPYTSFHGLIKHISCDDSPVQS